MLDVAMFALGILGLGAGKKAMQKQEREDYCRRIEQQRREHDEGLKRGLIKCSENCAVERLERQFYLCRKYSGKDIQVENYIFYHDEINVYNDLFKNRPVSFGDLADIPIHIAERVEMDVPQFITWMTNISQTWSREDFQYIGCHAYKMGDKYYTTSSASGRSRRFFDGHQYYLIELLPTDIMREECKQDLNLKKYEYLQPYTQKILDCGCPLQQFMDEHPKELLTDLFGNDNWKWYF